MLEEHSILRLSRQGQTLSIHHIASVALPGCREPGSCGVEAADVECFLGSFQIGKLQNQSTRANFSTTQLSPVEFPSRDQK